jgi:hypothetical protein
MSLLIMSVWEIDEVINGTIFIQRPRFNTDVQVRLADNEGMKRLVGDCDGSVVVGGYENISHYVTKRVTVIGRAHVKVQLDSFNLTLASILRIFTIAPTI